MEWENVLPPDLAFLIKKRLGGDFAAFAEFCESSGVLQNSFLPTAKMAKTTKGTFGETDISFLCSMFGSTIVSAANSYGADKQFENAKKLARWALALEPNHLPALECLSVVHAMQKAPKEFEAVHKRMEAIKTRLLSTPQANLSTFERGMAEVLREIES